MSDTRLVGGRYEIGLLIGQGGMGDVYLGRDTVTGDTVAIKSLKPEITSGDPALLERFGREGEALSRLNHPCIVKMLETLEENDRHYLIMEYVSGGSLKDLLEETPQLPVERVLDIALDLSDALARAHRLKIIHRDIKPANVLLAEDGTPRLTDFGVAQMGDRTRVTETGSLIGTYAYMSPEGCQGDELDARADIWSFGVMLYEMLAGRRPFEGTQPAAVLTAILTKPVPDLLQFRADAPAALLGLIYSMLEKDRDKRMSSVRLVGAQLEAFIKGSDTAIERMSDLFSEPERLQTPTPKYIELVDAATTPPIRSQTPTPRPLTAFPRKVVEAAPRIFISYRREDSIAVTGRLYDRLTVAFGDSFVFKDVDKIPVGANFKKILENEVAACDVLLAVIGGNWLDITDTGGRRRLDNPDDFVHIEIEAALQREDILVIPVLVNNATMPGIESLPDGLQELAFRNAAILRNDPDFNRDSQRLISQIQDSFEITPAVPAPRRRRFSWRRMSLLAQLALLAVIAFLLLQPTIFPSNGNPQSQTGINQTPIEPVAAGEYMVLVADMERLSGAERDVTTQIVDDLRQRLENDVTYSNLRVRHYGSVIRSNAEAQATAEFAGALVIVWGSYADNSIQLEVQVGDLSPLPDLLFPRDTVEKDVNVRVTLTDSRLESVVAPVLAIMDWLHMMEGNIFEMGRATAIYYALDVNPPSVMGNSTAARYHRFFIEDPRNPQVALEAISAAIRDDSSNPLPYISRAFLRQRLNDLESATEDIDTAARFGPEHWPLPSAMRGVDALLIRNQPADVVSNFDQFLQYRPDDWYGYAMRGLGHYLLRDYDAAQADIDRSLALNPQANYPYPFAILLAMREGRLADMQLLIETVSAKFPDPRSAERLLGTAYGSNSPSVFSPAMSAFVNTLLRQWSQVVEDADTAAAIDASFAEVFIFQGIAYCNLEQYDEAEAAYTRALETLPDFSILYGLRAEVRLAQNDLAGALQDARTVLQSPGGAGFAPLLPLIQSRELTCKEFLDFDFGSLETPTAEPVLPTLAPTAEPTAEATPEPTPSPAVFTGDYVVLVADLEPLGEARDVARFIARDLTRKLEDDVPFSHLRVRQYDGIITSDGEAREIAEAEGATVILWGSYTPDLIELEVQMGSLNAFPNMPYTRSLLERTVNVTLRMTDERTQSAVAAVLGVVAVLQTSDGNAFEALRTQAILDTINAVNPEAAGTGISANVYRYQSFFTDNTAQSITEMDAAIRLDPSNPILYGLRAAVRARTGRFLDMRRDADSMERLSPPDALFPEYLRATEPFITGELATAIQQYDAIIDQRPDDWFPYNMRAWLRYQQGDYEAAKADYALSIEREPNMNWPYIVSALIALREGRMSDARGYLDVILQQFPDPDFAQRTIRALLGDQADTNVVGPMFSSVGNFILKQYDQMLVNVQAALVIEPDMTDLYSLQGFAHCSLGQYAEGEAAYTLGIEREPDIALLYVLRGDVRIKQGNLVGALEDANHARQLIGESGQGEELLAYIDAGILQQVGCQNFFEWEPPR
ncbi:MAG: protein kinase [Anaerolineae bacterium]|nr:protein kinase [Anaerolineae bacterium]